MSLAERLGALKIKERYTLVNEFNDTNFQTYWNKYLTNTVVNNFPNEVLNSDVVLAEAILRVAIIELELASKQPTLAATISSRWTKILKLLNFNSLSQLAAKNISTEEAA